MEKRDYLERLQAWFGENCDGDFWIMHTWFEPTAAAPTLYAIVAFPGEIYFMRVHNTVGRLQVHVDKVTEMTEFEGVMND